MKRFCAVLVVASSLGFAQTANGPYKVTKIAKVGGAGGFANSPGIRRRRRTRGTRRH